MVYNIIIEINHIFTTAIDNATPTTNQPTTEKGEKEK